MAPFTTAEMQDALLAIDGQKCPGEDGLSRAFFTSYWDQIHQPLLAAFQQRLDAIEPLLRFDMCHPERGG